MVSVSLMPASAGMTPNQFLSCSQRPLLKDERNRRLLMGILENTMVLILEFRKKFSNTTFFS
jgi:hypothetical protein